MVVAPPIPGDEAAASPAAIPQKLIALRDAPPPNLLLRRWPELLALSAFITICAILIPRHEPWGDEAQSWMLAKCCGYFDLIFHRLGYEGTPGLWVTVLYPFAHFGAPYITLNWIGAFFEACGVALLLFASPFPRFLRLLLPFTFFLQYQYAIIGRSYCLLLLLGGACAYFYRRGRSHTLPFALFAALLAQLSLHSLLIAGCMALAFAWRHRIFSREILSPSQDAANADASAHLQSSAPARSDGTTLRHVLLSLAILAASFAFAVYVSHDKHALYEPPVPLAMFWRFPSDGIFLTLDTIRRAFDFALTGSTISGSLFLVLLTLWLAERHRLLEAMPIAAVALFFGIFYFHGHHSGILTVALFLVLWTAWPERTPPLRSLHTLFLVAFTGMLLVQIGWTRFCSVSDYRLPYSGARDTAALIKELPPGQKIFSYGFFTVALEPYFTSQPFANLPANERFWDLRDDNPVDGDIARLIAEKPDWVIDAGVAEKRYFGRMWPVLRRDYHLDRMVCGTQFFQDSFYVTSCYGIYHRNGAH